MEGNGVPRGKKQNMKFKNYILLLVTVISFVLCTSAVAQTSGRASYYGNRFHGRMTSDGSVYHRDSMTCAHRTLPFGTVLKVTNKKNGKVVVVRVNDRGPYVRGRVIDLSYAAAKHLGMLNQGVAAVKIENLGHESDPLVAQQLKSNGLEQFLDVSLPEFHFLDVKTGESYTVSEWREHDEQLRQRRLNEANAKRSYRIAEGKLTAFK